MSFDRTDDVWPVGPTIAWTMILFVGFVLGQSVGAVIAHLIHGVAVEFIAFHPWGVFWSTACAVPVVLAGVALLIRARSSQSVSSYLGLQRPPLGTTLLHLILFAPFLYGLGHLIDFLNDGQQNAWMLDLLREPDGKVALWIAVVVLAPLQEEWLFRGFYFRGIAGAGSWWRPFIAIVSGALIFASIHAQYNLAEMLYVFGLGIAFGLSRWHSGSLWPPIILHMVNNALSLWVGYGHLQSTGG